MKRNLLLALVVLSANLLTAQATTKSTSSTTAKPVVSTVVKSTTTAKTVTTTTAKRKASTATHKSTTTKKPNLSGTTTKTTTTTTTAVTTPTTPPVIQGTIVPIKGGQTNAGTTPNNGQSGIQIKGGSDANTNTNNGNQTKGGTTPNNTQPNQPQIKGGTDNNSNQNTNGGNIITNITQGDAASAIKEALMQGVAAGVAKVSVTDGYFGNSLIKIPFPQDVQIVESTLRSFGMGSMIDNLVLSLNRSAENAAGQAAPIFINGIKQMTLNDAISIVSNKQPDAATQFLQRTTTESLVSAFKPSIQSALDKTLATKYWSDITGYYNKIPFVSPVNSDLPDYVTRKAITGLFYMVAQEEAKIRKDPINQGSDIINKVFGAFKK